jgi:4-hydroxy-tetrahydrodipicolinate synthase
MFDILAKNDMVVAMKESTDDIRRTTDVLTHFGDRFDVFMGVDNLAVEALLMGANGWVAGLVDAFPRETVVIYELIRQGRVAEAIAIYRWFRPLLDLDVSTNLVQNIKLAEVFATGSNDRVRAPRLPLEGVERARVEKIVKDAIACRPVMPSV